MLLLCILVLPLCLYKNPSPALVLTHSPAQSTGRQQLWPFLSFNSSYSLGFAQDTFDHDRRQKSAISGRRLHWIFFEFAPVDFFNIVISLGNRPKMRKNGPIVNRPQQAEERETLWQFRNKTSFVKRAVWIHLFINCPEHWSLSLSFSLYMYLSLWQHLVLPLGAAMPCPFIE